MPVNYGLLNDFAQGIKEGFQGYKEAQIAKDVADSRKREERMMGLLKGVKWDEQSQDFVKTPEQMAKEQREEADKNLDRQRQTAILENTLLGKDLDLAKAGYQKTQNGLIETPEAKKRRLLDEEYKAAQTEALRNKPGKSDGELKSATELRKEYQSRPIVKDFNTLDTAYRKIQTAASNPSPAGDMTLIFSFMKMNDPGSTVREGEYATAQNAANIPDRIRNAYNKAVDGQTLNPAQRGDFVGQAKNLYSAQKSQLDEIQAEYQSLADRYGVDAGLIYSKPKLEEKKGLISAPQDGMTTTPAVNGSGGTKIKVSNGSETLLIDPNDLSDAMKDGFKQVK